MIEGSCHCGAVRIEVDFAPSELTDCRCTLCRRVGGLWAYYRLREVRVAAAAGADATYVQGDRMLALHRCAKCGCTTHWLPLGLDDYDRMGVNARMFAAEIVEAASVRVSAGPA